MPHSAKTENRESQRVKEIERERWSERRQDDDPRQFVLNAA